MTYREKLEQYRRGELNPRQAEEVRAELEKYEAMGDFLFEEEAAPEAAFFGAPSEEEMQPARFTEEIRKTVRRTFWRLGLTVGAVVLALCLLLTFVLPHVVDRFYYDPTEPSELWSEQLAHHPRMDLDLAVWTDLFRPCGYRDDTSARPLGYGRYVITFHNSGSSLERLNAVSGLLTRDQLTLFDPNAISNRGITLDTPDSLGETAEERAEFKSAMFRFAEEYWEENEECFGYVTLAEPMPYEELYRWCVDYGYSGKERLWFHVYADIGLRFSTGLGFHVNRRGKLWSDSVSDRYPNLVLDSGWMFETEPVQQHFLSLLQYTLDHPDFTKIMGTWEETILTDTRDYVDEHGLMIQGFAFQGSKDDFMKLEEEPLIGSISPISLY